jgi:hypothetical protein
MVHNDDFSSTKELLRDDDAAQSIGNPAASVPNNVGIALFESKRSSRIFWPSVSCLDTSAQVDSTIQDQEPYRDERPYTPLR